MDEIGEETLTQLVKEINSARKKSDDEHIRVLMTALKDYAFGDIVKATQTDMTMGVPILCTCFIEQLATFRYGQEVGVGQFVDFVNDYMPGYDARSLRNDLRNKLVHNYSVGEAYTIIRGYKQYHLKRSNTDNKIILNIESFVDDLGRAMDKYLLELETDNNIRSIALVALGKFPVVHFLPGS